MVFPIMVGMMCLFVQIIQGVGVLQGTMVDPSVEQPEQIYINGEWVNLTEQPDAPATPSFDLSSPLGLIAIFSVAIVAACFVGFTFLGSGLSEFSQNATMVSIVYLSLWAVLSAAMLTLIGEIPVFGTLIWLILTMMYMIGTVSDVIGGGD